MTIESGRGSTMGTEKPVIAVLGIGQMGLVSAAILAAGDRAGQGASQSRPGTARPSVVLWAHNEEEAGELSQTRQSARLPGFVLPDEVRVEVANNAMLAEATLIVSAVPVQYTRSVWQRLRKHIRADAGVISVAKGIENETLLRPTQLIADVLKDDPDRAPRRMGVLSGPTIAAELARCLPATMIAASDDPGFAETIQRIFSTSWLRIYTNQDMLGVELAGATKNVIGIAAGVLDGLQAGYNAKSALLARGLAEIARLGASMGAAPETFFGIAGVGDLATTCFSPEGRNRSCGEALGRGEKLEAFLARTPSVVEGVATTRSVMDLAQRYKVDMPITAAVHAVLFNGLDPLEGIGRLMARELKGERVG
jgi:glycerol-3-phosphate dehydrogenase (NAD(P)+)